MERLWEKINCPSQISECKIYIKVTKIYVKGIPQEVKGEKRKELHNYWLKILQI